MLVTLTCFGVAFGDELGHAIFDGDTDKVAALLKTHPDLAVTTNTLGATPLDIAVIGRQLKVIQLLLVNGANPNAKDSLGDTPLLTAVMFDFDSANVVEMLLTNKADVDATNNKGDTPLHFAAMLGRYNPAKVLLDYKADVNAKDNEGNTPLHFAANRGDRRVVDLLLENGANVNARDSAGHTPLYSAVPLICTNELEELIKENRVVTNSPGSNSPLILHDNRTEVAKLLLKHGGHE